MKNSTMSLNAELYRQLGYVADDKSSMEQILDYVKGVVAKMKEEKAQAARNKAQTLEMLDHAFKDYKDYLDGKDVKVYSWEDLKHELQEEGYYDQDPSGIQQGS